jgi:hypothetical protein
MPRRNRRKEEQIRKIKLNEMVKLVGVNKQDFEHYPTGHIVAVAEWRGEAMR